MKKIVKKNRGGSPKKALFSKRVNKQAKADTQGKNSPHQTNDTAKNKQSKIKAFFRSLDWILALCAWAFLSLEVCAVVVGAILCFFLSAETIAGSAMWMTVYNALSYTLALLMTVLIPPLLIKKIKAQKSKRTKPTANTSKTGKTELVSDVSKVNLSETTPSDLGSFGAKPTRELLGLRDLPTWVDLLLSPVGFVVYLIGASLVTALFSNFTWFDANQAQNVGYSTFLAGSDLIVAFIALVVIAPIAEEIIFRGWLYGKLRTRLSLPLAMLIVSLLFAAIHGQWNVAVNVFVLSLILCGLREITGTIYAGIILHMIKNGVAFYLVYALHMQ